MITELANIGSVCFLYGRKSDETGKRQLLTEGVQKQMCELKFKQMNESLVLAGQKPLVFGGWFYDERTSSVDWFCRESGQDMFQRLRRGDKVIVSKLDRAGRNQRDWCTSYDLLKEMGVGVRCCDPDIDFETAHGEMYAQIIMAFAQNERTQIRARTKAALEHKKLNGLPYNDWAPIGWKKVGTKANSRFKPDHEERAVCNEIRRLREEEGLSYRQLERWIRSQGVVHKYTGRKMPHWQVYRASGSQPFGFNRMRERIIASQLGFPCVSRKDLMQAYASGRVDQLLAHATPAASGDLP